MFKKKKSLLKRVSTYLQEKNIVFWLLCFLALNLNLWQLMIAHSIILMGIAWIFEGDWKKKWKIIASRKSLLVFISIYLLHVAALLYSTDFQFALKDLRIKIPLLFLPLILGTRAPLSFKQLKTILLFFVAGVFISTFINIAAYYEIIETKKEITNIHKVSVFFSHIRYALYLTLAIFSLAYILYSRWQTLLLKEKIIYTITALWLVFFLFVNQVLTGIVGFTLLFLISVILLLRKVDHIVFRLLGYSVIIFFILSGFSFLAKSINKYYQFPPLNQDTLAQTTPSGNKYKHFPDKKLRENGRRVLLYICDEELEQEWEKRSGLDFSGRDKKGNELRFTIYRYLTSKGLRKDSAGIAELSENDITMIENGYSNYIYKDTFSIYPRLYQIMWEIDRYRVTNDPSGHSVTQRFEFWHTAWLIFRDHLWTGTGTGDVEMAYEKKYEEIDSPLKEKYRLRAHNQLLTFFVTFGIIGGTWIIFALFFPVFYEGKQRDYLFMVFFLLAILSMLTEDTLESRAGSAFFAFFYSVLLFARKPKRALHFKNYTEK